MNVAQIDHQPLSLSGILLDRLESATATTVVQDAKYRAFNAARTHPNRFAAVAALNMKDPEGACDELKQCVAELGFVGSIVNGTTDGQFLDHPRFFPIFQTAENLCVPIYLHPVPPLAAVFVVCD